MRTKRVKTATTRTMSPAVARLQVQEFTDIEKQFIRTAARRVWNDIASDIIESTGGDVDRETVIECVTDADRLSSEVRRLFRPNDLERHALAVALSTRLAMYVPGDFRQVDQILAGVFCETEGL